MTDEANLRDEVAIRLRALQAIAGATDQQMGNYVGMSRTAWSNAVGLKTKKPNKPPEEAMVRLCKKSKLTMEWIYRGSYDNVPYALAIALQEALADPPRYPEEAVQLPGLVESQG
jgi:hypothetical protein